MRRGFAFGSVKDNHGDIHRGGFVVDGAAGGVDQEALAGGRSFGAVVAFQAVHGFGQGGEG